MYVLVRRSSDTGHQVDDCDNHLLHNGHTQLHRRISLNDVESVVVCKVGKDTVKESYGEEWKGGENGKEDTFLAPRQTFDAAHCQYGDNEKGDVDHQK